MTHTRHHPHTWELIRDDYLAGQTRAVLAERYGVGESTIRDRAAREGWRRVDVPPLGLPDVDESAESEPMRPLVSIIADAYRFADLAMRRGRPVEAQRYLSVAKGFERLNRADPLVRSLNEYWAEEEQQQLQAERFRDEWEAVTRGEGPVPPNPPSGSDRADEVVSDEPALADPQPSAQEPTLPAPDAPNPPNPPSEFEQPHSETAEEALLAPASASISAQPAERTASEQIAYLESLIAGRRIDRLPFHDLASQISQLKAAALTTSPAPAVNPLAMRAPRD